MPKTATANVHVRRLYTECRYGQLHVRTAFPSSGGFDERTTLVCLHRAPLTSRGFRPLLAALGSDRSIYAPDLPGHGESEAPAAAPSTADYAAAVGDFLDGLRLREVDVLGHHGGAAIAAELAIARPTQVRRVVLLGAPVFTESEREAFRGQPWPVPVREDGGHLREEWRLLLETRGDLPLEALAGAFADQLRNGAKAGWGVSAAMDWRATDRLGLVTQPVLLARPHDELWDVTPRARPFLKHHEWLEWPDLGPGLFERDATRIAADLRRFLDGAGSYIRT